MRKRHQILLVALSLVLWTVPAFAGFSPISNPDAVYLGQTNYIDFSLVSDNAALNSVTDGFLTINFSKDMYKLTYPNTWETWSMSPFIPVLRSDDPNIDPENPPPGFSYAQSITMTLSSPSPVYLFGFEAEPDMFMTFPMTANFYNGNTLLGTINQNVNGQGGAGLFAGSSTDPITSVQFTIQSIPNTAYDPGEEHPQPQYITSAFAVAAFCYSVPEPATMLLLGFGLIGLAGLRRKL